MVQAFDVCQCGWETVIRQYMNFNEEVELCM